MDKKIEMVLARHGECKGCVYKNKAACGTMQCIIDNKLCVKYVRLKNKSR